MGKTGKLEIIMSPQELEEFMKKKPEGEYFTVEMAPGLFLIGCDTMTPWGKTGKEIRPKMATGNSYLIVGKNRALLVDSAVDIPGLRKLAEELSKVPVQFALSHGHVDHIYDMREFDEVWLHPADECLLHGAFGMPEYQGIPEKIHYLRQGDVIDLGDRLVDIYEMQGHTDGSLLFYDRQTKILLTGDSIARRLLYGACSWVPVEEYIRQLEEIKQLDFEWMLSAHDTIFLPKSHIEHMINGFYQIPVTERRSRLPITGQEYIHVLDGNEEETSFIDLCFPVEHRTEMIESMERRGLGGGR